MPSTKPPTCVAAPRDRRTPWPRRRTHQNQKPKTIDMLTTRFVTRPARATAVLRSVQRGFAATTEPSTDGATPGQVNEQPANNVQSEAAPQEPRRSKIVLFGGNGFVGQGIVAAALRAGIDVVSISRSGAPAKFEVPKVATGRIEWKRGDINVPSTYEDVLREAVGVVSCVGAFGSNEVSHPPPSCCAQVMRKVNGDANITAIRAAATAQVPRFVYVSTVENNLPAFVLQGYFDGKRRTEQALLETFPHSGVVLRPGFIHGTRQVPLGGDKALALPLWLLGKPLESLFSLPPVKLLRDHVPGMQAVLARPIARDDLARVAVAAATGATPAGILSVDDLVREAARAQ